MGGISVQGYQSGGVYMMARETKIRIVVADDHPVVMEGLKLYLNPIPWLDIVGTALDLESAAQMVLDLRPDVFVCDLHFPGESALPTLHALQKQVPSTAIIVLTADRDTANLINAVGVGVRGFLAKDISLTRIPEAIRAVHDEHMVLDRAMLKDVFQKSLVEYENNLRRAARNYSLTDQELRVLLLLAEGQSNRSIANAFSISPNTVKTHVSHIFQKIGVSDRTQAAIWAVHAGLVS
ncbi:MAG: response regulator transcription factor [Anaerolineales bacterium]|jgi:DNA-binding NarL/FixJ family response regulator